MKNKLKTELRVVYHFLDKNPVEKVIKDMNAIKLPKGAYGYETFNIDTLIHEETNRQMFTMPYNESKIKVFGKLLTKAEVKKMMKESIPTLFTDQMKVFEEIYVDVKKFVLPHVAKKDQQMSSIFAYVPEEMDVVEHTLDNPIK